MIVEDFRYWGGGGGGGIEDVEHLSLKSALNNHLFELFQGFGPLSYLLLGSRYLSTPVAPTI